MVPIGKVNQVLRLNIHLVGIRKEKALAFWSSVCGLLSSSLWDQENDMRHNDAYLVTLLGTSLTYTLKER